MGRVCQEGTSRLRLLDWAKAAVEHFLSKARMAGFPALQQHRAALVCTCAPGLQGPALLCGFGSGDEEVKATVRQLKCSSDRGDVGEALSLALRFLARRRVDGDVDTLGWGRLPFRSEAAAIVVLTDGDSVVGRAPGAPPVGADDDQPSELQLTRSGVPTAEWHDGALRWDQHVFALLMSKMSAASMPKALKKLCDETGGWSTVSRSLLNVVNDVDMLLSVKLRGVGPMVLLRNGDGAGGAAAEDVHRACLAKAKATPYFWPLPEHFWVERNMERLPPRSAHPELYYRTQASGAQDIGWTVFQRAVEMLDVIKFPKDVYTLEWPKRPLLIGRGKAWPVYLRGAERAKEEPMPVGILSAAEAASSATLTVLPFNFPVLAPLLRVLCELIRKAQGSFGVDADLKRMQNMLPSLSTDWRTQFNAYLYALPYCYYASLKSVLHYYGRVESLVPANPCKFSRTVQSSFNAAKALAERSAQLHSAYVRRVEADTLDGLVPPEEPLPPGAPLGRRRYLSAGSVPPAELLGNWDHLRGLVFGGSGGAALRGLQVPGAACHTSSARRRPELLCVAGAQRVSAVRIGAMGSYEHTLVEREPLRDPTELNPPPDEDTPAGRLRAKLTVDFGNPYERAAARRRRPRGGQAPAQEDLVEDALVAADWRSFMEDTPRPYQREGGRAGESPEAAAAAVLREGQLKRRRRGEEAEEARRGPADKRARPEDAAPPSPALSDASGATDTEADGGAGGEGRRAQADGAREVTGAGAAAAAPAGAGARQAAGRDEKAPAAGAREDAGQKQAAAESRAPGDQIPPRYANATYPEGWIVVWSNREQRPYFFNQVTRTSSWTPPEGTLGL